MCGSRYKNGNQWNAVDWRNLITSMQCSLHIGWFTAVYISTVQCLKAWHTLYSVQCNVYTLFRLRAQGQCIALWMREDNKSRGCCWAFHCKATTSYYYDLHRHHYHHDKDVLGILWSSLPSLMFSKKNNAVLIKNNTDTETDSSSTAKMWKLNKNI